MTFLFEYQISRTTFINNVFNFNHLWRNLFSKNRPSFWCLAILSVYNISKSPFSMLICMWQSINIFIPHFENPQLKLPIQVHKMFSFFSFFQVQNVFRARFPFPRYPKQKNSCKSKLIFLKLHRMFNACVYFRCKNVMIFRKSLLSTLLSKNWKDFSTQQYTHHVEFDKILW